MIRNLNEHEKCIKNSNHIVKIVNKTPKYVFSKYKGALGHTDVVQSFCLRFCSLLFLIPSSNFRVYSTS
jgi:hypothetical protein